MNIERLTDSKYMVFMNREEAEKLKTIAQVFYHSNKSAALSEAISEGVNLALCIKELHDNEGDTEAITKKFCEVQLERRDRLWKVKQDASESHTE